MKTTSTQRGLLRKLQPVHAMVVGLSLSLIGGSTLAGAAETTEKENLFGIATWNVVAEARGVAPYAEIPRETPGGGPFAHAELESAATSLPSYAFAAFGYPSTIAQEGAIGIREAPGNVYAGRNSGKYKEKDEIAPAGDSGPYIRAETPGDFVARASGAFPKFAAGDVSATGGYSKADSYYDDAAKAMVGEAITHVQGLKVGDGLRIATFESWIKVTFVPNGEPKADYRLALLGIETAGKPAAEWVNRSDAYAGNKDLVIQGQGVGIGNLVQDFSTQMAQQGRTNPVFQGSATVQHPRVKKQGQYYVVAGAALDLRSENTPRQGTLFQTTGIRFGDVATEGYFDVTKS